MDLITYKNKESLLAMAKALQMTDKLWDIPSTSISFRIFDENGKTKQLHIYRY